jgi:hypothetical protein
MKDGWQHLITGRPQRNASAATMTSDCRVFAAGIIAEPCCTGKAITSAGAALAALDYSAASEQ